MKRWFDLRAQARGAEIVIYDEIGAFGIPAKAFLDELKALGPVAALTLRINSPGGSVFGYQNLINHQRLRHRQNLVGVRARPHVARGVHGSLSTGCRGVRRPRARPRR